MAELLPCPFCGGEAIYMNKNTIPNRRNPTIECEDCHCNMWELLDSEKDFLIQQWNTRTPKERGGEK